MDHWMGVDIGVRLGAATLSIYWTEYFNNLFPASFLGLATLAAADRAGRRARHRECAGAVHPAHMTCCSSRAFGIGFGERSHRRR